MKRIGDRIEFENQTTDMPPMVASFGTMRWNKTGSWRYIRPLFEDKTPPCTPGCPANERIPQYFALVKQGKFSEAWELIKEENPLPATCGRVCYHPCEGVCNRREFDKAVGIHLMERFVADRGYALRKTKPSARITHKEKIAIVGSGPTGLSCAYFLAKAGYASVVFEALPKPGGMLRVGIPEYRLPKAILDREIEDIKALGVEIQCNKKLGDTLSWADLKKYRAVFLAPGAHLGRAMGAKGEEEAGLVSGLTFLKGISLAKKSRMSGKVAVIGGGNTAIDTARTTLRLGGKPVILYRRSKAEMPAHPEEVGEAEKEGVEIRFLTAPVKVEKKGKKLVLTCQRMKLGPPDDSGRRKPVPVRGSEFKLRVDYLYPAIGEDPDLTGFASELYRLAPRIQVDKGQATNLPGIFAGGDAATGPMGTVVDAIASGKKAAKAIAAFLGKSQAPEIVLPRTISFGEVNLAYFLSEERPEQKRRPYQQGIRDFKEVQLGITEKQARQEALRCFSCGVCTECDNCLIFCPDVAVAKNPAGRGYLLDYDHCKGCGICVEECPREAMGMDEELKYR
jgi:NADPH-dependent glutamate synthase beta subunit-like oxidoreductase